MLRLPQPTTTNELIDIARAYHLDPTTWLKDPSILQGDILRKDVVLVETEDGLTTVRHSACLEAYHVRLARKPQLFVLHEDHQKLPVAGGGYLIVDRKLPFLQETVQFETGESVQDALERAARDEGGFSHFDRTRLRKAPEQPLEKDKPSDFFFGIRSRRRRELWLYDAYEGEFSLDGHDECDEHGIITAARWMEMFVR